jgi:hypothetical protein
MVAYTRYRGVKAVRGRFEAWWRRDGREIYLGRYAAAEIAALVWDAAAVEYGEPDLNFKPGFFLLEDREIWEMARAVALSRVMLATLSPPPRLV